MGRRNDHEINIDFKQRNDRKMCSNVLHSYIKQIVNKSEHTVLFFYSHY